MGKRPGKVCHRMMKVAPTKRRKKKRRSTFSPICDFSINGDFLEDNVKIGIAFNFNNYAATSTKVGTCLMSLMCVTESSGDIGADVDRNVLIIVFCCIH